MAKTYFEVAKEPLGNSVSALVPSYSSALGAALNWYSKNKSSLDALNFLAAHAKKQGAAKADLDKIKALSNSQAPRTIGWLARLVDNGAVLSKDDATKLSNTIARILDGSFAPVVEVAVDAKKTPRRSIQELMKEKCDSLLGEFEGMLDDVVGGKKWDADGKDSYSYLQSQEVPKAYVKDIVEWTNVKIREFGGAMLSKDEQIIEGYSNFNKKSFANLLKWLASVKESAIRYEGFKKATRAPRKRKEKPASVQAAKVKYKVEDTELKIRSVNPAELVGASQAWVYNTKSRMLAVYHATGSRGLGVKGTTLVNFDVETSKQKRLRKPDLVIKKLLDGGKIVLRKLLDEVKATEYNPNGRVNKDMILVRVL